MQLLAGSGWIFAWRMCSRMLGLASVVVLARLLPPATFGLVALAVGLIQTVEAFTTIGAEDALVRGGTPDPALLDTAFTLNLLRAVAAAVAIAALAAPAARFLGEPRIAPMMLVLAGGTLLSGCTNIGIVTLRRDMRFDREFRLLIGPRLVGAVTSFTLALLWRDHWALIAGMLAQNVLRVAMSYGMHPHRPRLRLPEYRALLGFSLWAWALMVIIQVQNRVETLLVGRALGVSAAGLYETGREVGLLPSSELVEPACRAAFSGFARAAQAGGDPARACLDVLGRLAPLAMPAGIGIALTAGPLVRLMLGPRWAEAVPVVQAMGVAGAAAVFGLVASTALRVHGMQARSFAVHAAMLPLRVGLLWALLPGIGVAGAAVAMAAVTVVRRLAMLGCAMRHFGFGLAAVLRVVGRAGVASGAMALALWGSGAGVSGGPGVGAAALALGGAVALGGASYLAVLLGLWRLAGRPEGFERWALGRLRRPFG